MPLNDRQIRNTKPAAKEQKLSDGGGLYLLVKPNGGKYWRLNFRFGGKQKTLALGIYPAVSLVEARAARERAKQMLAQGIDPSAVKQQTKREKQMLAQGIDPSAVKQQTKREKQDRLANTFAHLAREWHEKNRYRWKPNHAARVLRYFENDVFPTIGSLPISEIRVKHIKAMLDGISARGVYETAEKIRQWTGAVFKYAAMLELTENNPAMLLQGYLAKQETEHMPALPHGELTEFYRRLSIADAEPANKLGRVII